MHVHTCLLHEATYAHDMHSLLTLDGIQNSELVPAWQGACNNGQPSLNMPHISCNINANDVNQS